MLELFFLVFRFSMFSYTAAAAFFLAGCTGPPSALFYRPVAEFILGWDSLRAAALAKVLISGLALAVTGYHCTCQFLNPDLPPRIISGYLLFILPTNLAGDLAGGFLALLVPSLFQLIILSVMCTYASFSLFRHAFRLSVFENSGMTVKVQSMVQSQERGFLMVPAILLVVYCLCLFIRGTSNLSSIAGIKMCSGAYWIVTAVEFVLLCTFAWLNCAPQNRVLLCAVVIEGLLSGIIGMSVGVVLTPLLLDMTSMTPLQSISISIICVAVISTSSALTSLASGFLSADTAYYAVVTFFAGLLFQHFISILVEWTRRPSLAVWLVASFITLGGCLVFSVSTTAHLDGIFISQSLC